MQMSISQLADLTGKDRRTVTDRLDGLAFEPGPKNANLYETSAALALIYGQDACSYDEARKRQALSQAALNEVRTEELRKTRIPIDIVTDLWDSAFQAFAATLKASELPKEKINEVLDALRTGEIPAKW